MTHFTASSRTGGLVTAAMITSPLPVELVGRYEYFTAATQTCGEPVGARNSASYHPFWMIAVLPNPATQSCF